MRHIGGIIMPRLGLMFKRTCSLILISSLLLLTSGCALIGAAASAGAAYGIYMATAKK
jgi:hypothetical protein